jgi:hypothetical protein
MTIPYLPVCPLFKSCDAAGDGITQKGYDILNDILFLRVKERLK